MRRERKDGERVCVVGEEIIHLLKVIQALSNKVDGLDPIQEYGAGDVIRVPFICDEYDT